MAHLFFILFMKKSLENRYRIILFAIVIIAIFLRFYQLGQNPPSLDWDEASIGYNAYSVLKTGADEYGNKMPLSFRSFDDFKPPVYVYLTVPSVAVFGLNEMAVRFPSALIGVLAVIVVYFFVKEILINWDRDQREWIALFSAFFLAISPWHLQFSRAAFEGNTGMFFLILSLLLFLKAFKNKLFYIPFGLFFVLSMYSYHSFRLIDPILLIALIVIFYKSILKQKLYFALSLIIIFVLATPIYLSFLVSSGTGARLSMVTVFSDESIKMTSAKNVEKARAEHDLISEILNNRRFIFIPIIAKGYLDHFNFGFLFLHGDGGVQHHAYNMGMLYLWDFPFILLGMYLLIKKRDRRILFLFFLFFLAPIPSAITTGTPHPVRAIAMIPEFQIFTTVGFVGFAYYLLKLKRINKFTKYFLISLPILLLAINISYYLYSYYVLTPLNYGYFWQYGNKQAIEYARTRESQVKRIVMTYKYDQPYIYYLFYNKVDPAWYQKNWDTIGNGQIERFSRKINKYEFRNIDFSKDNQISGSLLIGTPDEIPEGVNVEKVIRFPDGKIAYKIIKI